MAAPEAATDAASSCGARLAAAEKASPSQSAARASLTLQSSPWAAAAAARKELSSVASTAIWLRVFGERAGERERRERRGGNEVDRECIGTSEEDKKKSQT